MIRSLSLLVLLFVAACSTLPNAELQAYRDAFEAGRSAAQPLLETYTVSERAAIAQQVERGPHYQKDQNGFFTDFDPAEAVRFSTLSLPPGAQATQRALDAISRYNDTLVALAENRNIGEAQAQIKQMTADLNAIAGNVSILTGPLPGADILGTAASSLLNLLTPVIAQDNREEFRRIVLQGQPHVKAMIASLRRLTRPQFGTITAPLRHQWDAALGRPDDQKKIADDINGWYKAFADYVVLLDTMEQKLDAMADAVRNPKKRALLETAVAGVGDVKAYSDILRQSIAQLHAPK